MNRRKNGSFRLNEIFTIYEAQQFIQSAGIGIKPEDIHRVLEKGFTGSTGRIYAKSTGMWLYPFSKN
jgi:hypothetical protein